MVLFCAPSALRGERLSNAMSMNAVRTSGGVAVALALLLCPTQTTGASARQPTGPSDRTLVTRWIGSRSVRGIRTDGPLIEIRKGSGWVFTSGLYGDFTLNLQFRIAQAGTDAGLFVRAVPGERPNGYRIALSDSLDDNTAGLVSIADGVRAVPFEKPRLQGIVSPRAGAEWHGLEVSCEGPRLSVRLNGQPIADLDRVVPAVGVIGLAGQRGRLELRDVHVVRLNEAPTRFIASDPERGIFRTAAGNGVTAPRLVKEVKPNYRAGAMARKVQGVVWLEAIVLPDGTVGEIQVTRTLDLEMDEEAIATVKQWQFTPGSKDGAPVAVVIEVEMSFTLRK